MCKEGINWAEKSWCYIRKENWSIYGNNNNTGKELEKGICTNTQSILKSINRNLNDGTQRIWRQDSKWTIGAIEEDLVTNAHANKRNLYYDVTGICDVNISQPKTRLEQGSSRFPIDV